jgi:hypothetical protein
MMAAYHARWVGALVWLQCAYYGRCVCVCVCAMQIRGPELCRQDERTERNGTGLCLRL